MFMIYGDDVNLGLMLCVIVEVMWCVYCDLNKFLVKMECYMFELYRDDLIDLFLLVGMFDVFCLDIKKDKKGWVMVFNVIIVLVMFEDEIIEVIYMGLKVCKIVGMKMNVELS